MKKNTTKKQNTALKFKTFDRVFAKAAQSEVFVKEYDEEIVRLRLANEIRVIRTQKKFTQKHLAEKANMPQSVIARIESGTHSISLGTLNRVAQVLGKKVQLV
jgi:ribosome-binding protein aMBF1 (putative translation factor)